MDNIKESKGPFSIFIVFLVVGCLLFGGGFYCGINLLVTLSKLVPVTATITEINTYSDSHDVFVTFSYDGETYENVELNFWDTSFEEGGEIEIFVNPDNPSEIFSSTPYIILTVVLFVFGGAFAGIGGYFVDKWIRKKKKEKKLILHGSKIECEIIEICVDRTYRVNGKAVNSFFICQNGDKKFKSASFKNKYTFDIGSTCTVYIDPTDETNYYVDLKSACVPVLGMEEKEK